MQQRDHDKNQDGLGQVINNINDTDSLGICLGSDIADNCSGYAVSEVDTAEHYVNSFERDEAAHCKCLQDTNGSRRALQHEGNCSTY